LLLLCLLVLLQASRFIRPTRCYVQPPVDGLWNRLDLRAQLLLNAVQIESILIRNEVNCQAQVPEAARTTNAVEVRLADLGKIKVDDDVDGLDVDSAGEKVGTDKIAADPVAEIVEDTVAMRLKHLCV
jgi:hypothetical protein